jgi:hypothetical protein
MDYWDYDAISHWRQAVSFWESLLQELSCAETEEETRGRSRFRIKFAR